MHYLTSKKPFCTAPEALNHFSIFYVLLFSKYSLFIFALIVLAPVLPQLSHKCVLEHHIGFLDVLSKISVFLNSVKKKNTFLLSELFNQCDESHSYSSSKWRLHL